MYIRDVLYKSFSEKTASGTNLNLERSDCKEHRTHTVNSVLKSARFLVTLPRASWHDTRRVTVCSLPHPLVIGEDCLYTRARESEFPVENSGGRNQLAWCLLH